MHKGNWVGAVFGFLVSAFFAVSEGWTLPEFCWSTWLAGLLFSYACPVIASLQVILFWRKEAERFRGKAAIFSGSSDGLSLMVLFFVVALLAGGAALYAYSFLFSFYGIFLSVFAEMEPLEFFGRNGFINSDFYTPVAYLFERFWPMALGMLVGNSDSLFASDPWIKFITPVREVVRIHLMVLLMPFLAMAAWAVLGERYHSFAVVVLLALFYGMPASSRKKRTFPHEITSSKG